MRKLALLSLCFAAMPGSLFFGAVHAADKGKPIPVADVKHEGPVDFEKEVLPILRRKCLACHNATEKESDLVLETPQTILKGGSEGPAAIAGKGAESLLILLSARQKDPVMPPDGNDVKAKPLTSAELGLIKLWIDQGAKGQVLGASAPLVWQPLPPGVSPIFAVAISPDGQFAAAGRANQIFIYHVPSKREVGRLTDPNLLKSGIYKNPGVAHLDLVQSLAFSPDNELLASGGYREVKFWKRARNAHVADLKGLEAAPKTLAVSRDSKFAAFGEESGKIKLFELASGKVAQNLQGHTAAISGLAFTADGSKLVSGSQDKTFRIWTTADGKQVGAPVETPAPVNAVALVTEDKQIAVGNADNLIRIYDVPAPAAEGAAAEPPKPAKEIKGHTGPITSLAAVLPTGAELLSGSQDGTVRVWNVANGSQAKTMTHGGPVDAVAVRPDGQRYASVSSNNSAKLWNATNSQMVAELKGDFRAKINVDNVTRAVALAKKSIDAAKKDLDDATKRKTAEEDNAKKAAEALTKAQEDFNKKVEAAKQPEADKVTTDKALADATTAKTAADEAKKKADTDATQVAEALTKAQAAATAATKVATDAAAAAKSAADKLAKAQEAAKADAGLADAAKAAEKESQEAEAKSKTAAEAKAAADKAVADLDAGKKAADEAKKKADAAATAAQTAFAAADQKVKQLAPMVQKAVDEKNAADRTFKAAQRSVERAAESVKAATDSLPALDAIVKQKEEATKQTEAALEVAKKAATDSEKPLKSIAFSSDGLTLATAGDDQMVHTWDGETGAAIESFSGQGAAITAVGFTADKNVISAGQNNSIVVWNTNPEWTLVRTIGSADSAEQFSDRVTALSFSADGKQLATGGGEPSRSGEMKIWNVESGSLVQAFKEPHSDTIFGLEFSPDGKLIASCGADRFVKIHETSGKFVRSFEGHTHHVLGVSWRADGRLLASGGADNVIKIWDVKTGDQARTIQGFAKEVTSVRFVADGDNLVASGGDNSVRLKNAANGNNVRDFAGAADFMYSAGASGDGKTYVAGGQDSVLRVWREDGQSVVTFTPPKVESPSTPEAKK